MDHLQQMEELAVAVVPVGEDTFVAVVVVVVVVAAEVTIEHMDYLVDSIRPMRPYLDQLHQNFLQTDPRFGAVVGVAELLLEVLRKDFHKVKEQQYRQRDRLSSQVGLEQVHHRKDSVMHLFRQQRETLKQEVHHMMD